MNNIQREKAELVFKMLFKPSTSSQLDNMVSTGTLNADKSLTFVVENILNNNITNLDLDLYSRDINEYYKLYLEMVEENKPIHGDFFNDLRQRYFDLLNCTPIENPSEPLSDTHIAWMLTKLSDVDMSETKKHRWLGYIQGCMAYRGLITVNEERDNTRQIFKGR